MRTLQELSARLVIALAECANIGITFEDEGAMAHHLANVLMIVESKLWLAQRKAHQ